MHFSFTEAQAYERKQLRKLFVENHVRYSAKRTAVGWSYVISRASAVKLAWLLGQGI